MNDHTRQVYLLNPRELSPETIAVTFAKTSRSPQSFRDIAVELSETQSHEFNEKWVVGYGHASVAEHAVLHLALENVSRLAIETIQSSRLASFTEKSSRYQRWSPNAFFIPPELLETKYLELYLQTCRMLFSSYDRAIDACQSVVEADCPRREDETRAAYDRKIKPILVDSCRFLLPAASLANLGMTINARELEHLISKMLSSPLGEVRMIGSEMKTVAQAEVPTLVKYARRVEYLERMPFELRSAISTYAGSPAHWCSLVNYDQNDENRFLAALLYRFGSDSYESYRQQVATFSMTEKEAIMRIALAGMRRYDWPVREAEHVSYTFDLIMDQGAFYEFKRHRMMTLSPQDLTCTLGYASPKLFERAGFQDEYQMAMDSAAIAFQQIAGWNPSVASYLVPNGFLRRTLVTLNYREAFNLLRLRSGTGAHFSVRRVAQQMAEEIRRVHPLLGSYLSINPDETWHSISADYFSEE